MNLLGIDVGFSKTRPTTGIAWMVGPTFGAGRTHADWERRRRHIPDNTGFAVIAIDGPVTPRGTAEDQARLCERLLIRGAFQSRCKPGLSHVGYGRDLRRAAGETAEQIEHLAGPPAFGEQVRPGRAVIEAFPNAFLGVLLPEAAFSGPKIARTGKFDWLYDSAVERGVLVRLLAQIGFSDTELLRRIENERDHEKRAAWICLLTAAAAATGTATRLGDPLGGWIWLPPIELWAPWASEALTLNKNALGFA
jgi:predicted nuclease with RNAse H fold